MELFESFPLALALCLYTGLVYKHSQNAGLFDSFHCQAAVYNKVLILSVI